MPTKTKSYKGVIFWPEVIKQAAVMVASTLPKDSTKNVETILTVETSEEKWQYDSEEEFFADYRKSFKIAHFYQRYPLKKREIEVWVSNKDTRIKVEMPTRADVEKVFDIFEANVEKCRLPIPSEKVNESNIRIFIGHGQSPQWRDLKDHLRDKHGFEVEHYERGARAGLTIKEVLDSMVTDSSFAILVLTGEGEDKEGKFHARDNVIHELGLFQGYLGWRRVIALTEEGVAEFSNIHGLNQIRFNSGNIKETFGEILATIKREFEED